MQTCYVQTHNCTQAYGMDVVILWLNQFHLTSCSDYLQGQGIFIFFFLFNVFINNMSRICLMDLPSMDFLWKGVGLGYILAFLLC